MNQFQLAHLGPIPVFSQAVGVEPFAECTLMRRNRLIPVDLLISLQISAQAQAPGMVLQPGFGEIKIHGFLAGLLTGTSGKLPIGREMRILELRTRVVVSSTVPKSGAGRFCYCR